MCRVSATFTPGRALWVPDGGDPGPGELEPRHGTGGERGGGGEANRTPGLLDATEALYQLSYTPVTGRLSVARRGAGAEPPFGRDRWWNVF